MLFPMTVPVPAAEAEDGWRNLTRVTRARTYTVLLRSGTCRDGPLISANDVGIVLGAESGAPVPIKRADILRFSDASVAPVRAAIYSGRSSWADVKASAPRASDYLQITAKSGEESKWKQPTIQDDSVAADGRTAAKARIRYVFLVRFKPLTRTEEYFHEESFDVLAPRLWFNGLLLGKISVLLYNAALPEDNSPAGCR